MKSVYIHIPFCNTICSYCDFPKLYSSVCDKQKYLEQLEYEIKSNYKGEYVSTIYIGGGTPTVLNNEELIKLLQITKIFNKEKNLEFTVECNIESIDESKLKILKKYGVNRISIGIQSFNNKIIKFLNRNHTKKEAILKIKLIKKYFDNINIDLMYAIPGETIKILKKDLNTFLKLDLNHISCYSLIIEPHTKLYINNINNIDQDMDYKMYKMICKKLKKYNHYEISNFSKAGSESQHNLNYWNNLNYYGFGMGASGYIGNIRYNNTKNINDYLKGNFKKEVETLSIKEQMEEEMFLGLRKLKGVNIKEFEEKYNKKLEDVFNIKDLIENKILKIENDFIFINENNIYTSNDILVRFIGD